MCVGMERSNGESDNWTRRRSSEQWELMMKQSFELNLAVREREKEGKSERESADLAQP